MIVRHGAIVELGATERVFGHPQHPYTQALLASVPQLHTKWRDLDEPAPSAPGSLTPSGLGADVGRLVEVDHDHFVAVPATDESEVSFR
jgi:peptide/nickel transport system ATP-binding protein